MLFDISPIGFPPTENGITESPTDSALNSQSIRRTKHHNATKLPQNHAVNNLV